MARQVDRCESSTVLNAESADDMSEVITYEVRVYELIGLFDLIWDAEMLLTGNRCDPELSATLAYPCCLIGPAPVIIFRLTMTAHTGVISLAPPTPSFPVSSSLSVGPTFPPTPPRDPLGRTLRTLPTVLNDYQSRRVRLHLTYNSLATTIRASTSLCLGSSSRCL